MKDKDLAADLKALSSLLIQATQDTTSVVEAMHHEIAGGPKILGRPFSPLLQPPTRLIYNHIRRITRLVGYSLNFTIDQLEPALSHLDPGAPADTIRAILCGVCGDHLAQNLSPLSINLSLRHQGQDFLYSDHNNKNLNLIEEEDFNRKTQDPLPIEHILLDIHGSSMSDLMMSRNNHHHPTLLAKHLNATNISVFYNTGLHIPENGLLLANELEKLFVNNKKNIKRLDIICFSMGGLVTRSAVHQAIELGMSWPKLIKNLVTLGTPHHGAPLERAGNLFETLLGVSRYSQPLKQLARLRSAGITDLRHGTILPQDLSSDRFELQREDTRSACPLPPHITTFAIAATRSPQPAPDAEAPDLASLKSDGLVPVPSALGIHPSPHLHLHLPPTHQHILYGSNHLDLLHKPEVFDKLKAWLQPPPPSTP
jgi:hypothetical protein